MKFTTCLFRKTPEGISCVHNLVHNFVHNFDCVLDAAKHCLLLVIIGFMHFNKFIFFTKRFDPLIATLKKCSNILKQFVGNSRRII